MRQNLPLKILILCLHSLLLSWQCANAQDLSLQVNLSVGELQRGQTLPLGFIVSNPSNEAATRYRVEFYASDDEVLDSADVILGSFESNDGIPNQAFRENVIGLDTCALETGQWRIIGKLEDVEPDDPDSSNDVGTARTPLALLRDDDDPRSCVDLAAAAKAINAGLNDAWYNPSTPGQGLLLNVYPQTGALFLGWFTFDSKLPEPDTPAILGSAEHRWLTASGGWSGNEAVLSVVNSSGGQFNQTTPTVNNDSNYGTIVLEIFDCNNANVHYELADSGLNGSFPIQRVSRENVKLCELLVESMAQSNEALGLP